LEKSRLETAVESLLTAEPPVYCVGLTPEWFVFKAKKRIEQEKRLHDIGENTKEEQLSCVFQRDLGSRRCSFGDPRVEDIAPATVQMRLGTSWDERMMS